MLLPLLCALACRPGKAPSDDSQETGGLDTQDSADTGQIWELDSLQLYDGPEGNHLLPTELLVLGRTRRAYSHALGSGTLAEVDLDSQELLRLFPLTGTGTSVELFDGGDSTLYLARRGKPAFQRLDLETGALESVEAGMPSVAGVLPLADGKLLVAGTTVDGGGILQVLDSDYSQLAFTALPDVPRALISVGSDQVAVVLGTAQDAGSVSFHQRSDLSQLRSCEAPFGARAAAFTPQGDLVLATEGRIGLAPCSTTLEARDPQEWTVGHENMEVIATPEGVIVLDRVGEDDPNWSLARRYSTATGTLELSSTFTTGKNSGRGGRDSTTGLLWVNSEGTTELRAYDPATGKLRDSLPLGLHLESLATGSERGVVFVTGRLSGLIARADFLSGEIQEADIGFRWPVAPVVIGDELWVLDQLGGTLHVFAAADLQHLYELELGWSQADSLTLSDALLHPETGRLWVSSGFADELVEVDPSARELLQRVSLGPDPLDKDSAGRLELLAYGEGVIAARTWDGRLSVVSQGGDVQTHSPLTGTLESRSHMQFSLLSQDQETLFVGPYAIATSTFSHLPEQEAPWSFAFGVTSEDTLAWRWTDSTLLRVAPDGTETALETGMSPDANPEWLQTAWGERLIATEMDRGALRVFTPPE